VLELCWLIGEYSSDSLTTSAFPSEIIATIISHYHDILELFAYERMSLSKATQNSQEDLFFSNATGSLHLERERERERERDIDFQLI
jgi:hypothetical protein